MKAIIDLIPVLLFFVAYYLADFYVATWVLMGALIAQIILLKAFGKPVEKMHWITLALVIGFGALTLMLRDPMFLMWKPTVVNWLFAAAVLGSQLWMKRSIIERMLSSVGPFPGFVVANLSYAWALFLFSLGVLNLFVAYNFSEEFWVNFKLFGLIGLTLAFTVAQGFYLARYMPDEEQAVAPNTED